MNRVKIALICSGVLLAAMTGCSQESKTVEIKDPAKVEMMKKMRERMPGGSQAPGPQNKRPAQQEAPQAEK